MNRVTGSACCLVVLALAAGCEPTGAPPKPKAGGESDRGFVRTLVILDHEAAAARLTAAGREVRHPALKASIDKGVPSVQHPVRAARQLSPTLPPV